jgi:hypothetical protein
VPIPLQHNLLGPKRDDRIDPRRAAGRQIAGSQTNHQEQAHRGDDRIDKLEDRAVRANPQGEGEQRNQRETGVARERAQAIADIADERVKPRNDPGIARTFCARPLASAR